MKPWRRLKRELKVIRLGKPGMRFAHHYHRHQRRQEPRWRATLLVGLGFLLTTIGAILGFAPARRVLYSAYRA
ncbi:hypothetical protein CAI21_08280 [Alkalilimnicola ehrlichii]|uniref:hypothetical protein n=1 Tax=Alkalilimnicola ehrlichii TaxID=351052 RepID=UPI000E2E87F1|nr:hypothetical protein [Alkalilimnicola ehrlichii]RFA29825.1 hypothetical protein CAI21_08280 [Alkalilimnicola ehrlichii]